MKKTFVWIIFVCMLIAMIPVSTYAAGAEHIHSWSNTWEASPTHHWHACQAADCPITTESKYSGYGAHDFSTYPYRCTVCHYGSAHEHYGGNATCQYNAICEGCGTIYGETNPNNHQHPNGYGERIDGSSHKIMCGCGYVFVNSEPHIFTPWSKNSDGTEERWCEKFLYAETRGAQHNHSYSKATCIAPATCSCGNTTGAKDPSNHTGGTEMKGAVEATKTTAGYSGDIYCKGCGGQIETGKVVPKIESIPVEIAEDAAVRDVTFQLSAGIALPDGARLTVNNCADTAPALFSLLDNGSKITKYDYDESAPYYIDKTVYKQTDGTQYSPGEVVLIDGLKYCIGLRNDTGSVLPMIRLSDGVVRSYDMASRRFVGETGLKYTIEQPLNQKVIINDVYYDVALTYQDESNNKQTVFTYQDDVAGFVVGDENFYLYSQYAPDNIQQGTDYVGQFVNTKEPQRNFDLKTGVKYDVYRVCESDIKLLTETGNPILKSEKPMGTLSYSFDLGVDWKEDESRKLIAIHLTEDSSTIENSPFGEVTFSHDHFVPYATFSISHFSPFVVYAFTEAKDVEIKSITSNASLDLTWLWITIPVAVIAATVVIVVLLMKRKKDVRHD